MESGIKEREDRGAKRKRSGRGGRGMVIVCGGVGKRNGVYEEDENEGNRGLYLCTGRRKRESEGIKRRENGVEARGRRGT